MSRRIDLTNKKFGRWQVIDFAYKDKLGKAYWNCRCRCDTKRSVSSTDLRTGKSKSCGCYSTELKRKRIGRKNGMYGKTFSKEQKEKWRKQRSGSGNPRWLGGRKKIKYGSRWLAIRNKAKKRDNYTCQMCGESPKDRSKIECHHIDYDKQNNNMDNLINLCLPCHYKTNKNEDYWTKYFIEMLQ